MQGRTTIRLASLVLLAASATVSYAEGFPPLAQLIANCENRWILGRTGESADLRPLGYVYVDPHAGFTIESHGNVGLSTDGNLVRKPDELEGKARLIIRVANNYEVACLSDEQRDRLGLSSEWEYRENYRDKRPPGEHYTAWASHYNHIGASEQALEFAEHARAEHYSSASLDFEHGFALNALGKYDEALEVLGAGLRRYPRDSDIAAEIGYAYLSRGDHKQAIDFYRRALDYDKPPKSSRRAEYARNISLAYGGLQDRKHAEEWARKSAEWEKQQKESAD